MRKTVNLKTLMIFLVIGNVVALNSNTHYNQSDLYHFDAENANEEFDEKIIDLRDLALKSMEKLYLSYEKEIRKNYTPQIEITEKVKFENYERWHLKYLLDKYEYGYAFLLIPTDVAKNNTKTPLIICPHPTYYGGKDRVVNNYSNVPETISEASLRQSRSYALDLVQKGFIVFAPDKPAYGERRVNKDSKDFIEEQRQYTRKLREKYPKWGLNGKTIYDLKVGLDYLVEMSFIDEDAIGCFGHSLGAWDTLMFSALDNRVKASACSSGGMLRFQPELWRDANYLEEYLSGNKNGNLNINTNIFQMLIAPRSFLTIYSLRDPNYKQENLQMLDGYRDIFEYYKKVNGNNKTDFSYYLNSSGHTITPVIKTLIYEWFEEKLK